MAARRCLILIITLLTVSAARADAALPSPAAPDVRSDVVAAISNMLTLERPGEDGLATAYDGNKYVQCRRLKDRSLRCEAGGALMQPSLRRVLLPTRIARLNDLGWNLDPSFGNYLRDFPPDTSADKLADAALAALSEGYGADLDEVDVATTWVASEPCPPRNGPRQNLAGVIDAAPSMRNTAVHACSYTPAPGMVPQPVARSPQDLMDTYGSRVTGEIDRLRVNGKSRVYVIFGTDVGYIQCQREPGSDSIYCEAASAESLPVLASVLTPERLDRLHAAGFTDPGRSQNYEKTFALDAADDAAIARQILTVLYDVYGYIGAKKLEVVTN